MHQPGSCLQAAAAAGCGKMQELQLAQVTIQAHQYSLVLSGTRAASTLPVGGMV